ncbi:hypothetical protein [uncultured Rhodoblastus sp.]|uniref:hypothetical protein n=1 Tax=uncultured Rhodoblastus sp. TaxID=543037 RepID=UPI0025DB2878|nr:hypothetical protein [uncultured Rhodoblastus sp.]
MALTSAPHFCFLAGDNTCGFAVDRQDRASSYDLAARLEYVLKMEAAERAGAKPEKSVTQETVHVAVYEHKHGSDMRAFASPECVTKWRREIADEWFEREIGKAKPADPEAMADEYFEHVGDASGEYFSSQEVKIEG